MKQLIVLMATITLGILIYNMIAGNGDDSILNTLRGVWSNELLLKTRIP